MKMGKHSLLMMAGCAVALVGVFLLPALGVKLGGVLPLLLVLACPLSMMFMMGSMGRNHDHAGHGAHDPEEADGASCHQESALAQAPTPRALPAPAEKE